jgi:hypothetical protein
MTSSDPFSPGPAHAHPHPVPGQGAEPSSFGDAERAVQPSWEPAPAAPTGLAPAAVVLAAVWTTVQIGALLTSFAASDAYSAAAVAGVSAFDVYTAYDAVTGLQLPIQAATFVVACLWLQRARQAGTFLSPAVRQARGPVWVWLGWVVPVVSLWFPYQVVRDVRTAAEGTLPRGLGWWWACWIMAMWFTNQAAFTAMGLREASLLSVYETVATVVTVVAAAHWVGLVRRVTGALSDRLATV